MRQTQLSASVLASIVLIAFSNAIVHANASIGKLYWSFNSPSGLQSVLMRSNLDGSGAQSLLESSSGGDRPIALDLTSGFLYAGFSGRITRYDLDGGNPTVIFNTTTNPSGISGIVVIPVPEPAGISLLFVGATGILVMLRRAKEHAHLVIFDCNV